MNYTVVYWVLIKETEETVAITRNLEYAQWIRENFPVECVVRYSFER